MTFKVQSSSQSTRAFWSAPRHVIGYGWIQPVHMRSVTFLGNLVPAAVSAPAVAICLNFLIFGLMARPVMLFVLYFVSSFSFLARGGNVLV